MNNRFKRLGLLMSIAAIGVLGSIGSAGADVLPHGKARGATTVTLNQATIGAVVDLGLTPAPVSPGVLGMHGDELQAAFPIVGNRGAASSSTQGDSAWPRMTRCSR